MIWLLAVVSAVTVMAGLDRLDAMPRTFEPYAGVVFVDGEAGPDPFDLGARVDRPGATDLLGARLLAPTGDRWMTGIEYGYARFGFDEFSGGCSDEVQAACFIATTEADFHALLGQVRHRWPVGGNEIHALGGAGIVILKTDEADSRVRTLSTAGRALSLADVAPPDYEAEVEPSFLVGAGVTRPVGSRIAVTAEARDLIQLCRNAPDDYKERSSWFLCDEDKTLHHWQLTTGLRLTF